MSARQLQLQPRLRPHDAAYTFLFPYLHITQSTNSSWDLVSWLLSLCAERQSTTSCLGDKNQIDRIQAPGYLCYHYQPRARPRLKDVCNFSMRLVAHTGKAVEHSHHTWTFRKASLMRLWFVAIHSKIPCGSRYPHFDAIQLRRCNDLAAQPRPIGMHGPSSAHRPPQPQHIFVLAQQHSCAYRT